MVKASRSHRPTLNPMAYRSILSNSRQMCKRNRTQAHPPSSYPVKGPAGKCSCGHRHGSERRD